jgi:hypothetical protein
VSRIECVDPGVRRDDGDIVTPAKAVSRKELKIQDSTSYLWIPAFVGMKTTDF